MESTVQRSNWGFRAAGPAILWIIAGQIICATISHAAAPPAIDPDLVYLGQTPPGLNPCRFPPDSLLADGARAWHHGPVFSPGLDEMYWTYFDGVLPAMYAMEVVDGAWGPLHRPSFASLDYGETCPVFSAGGDSLYFLSDRPERGIYLVTRAADDWSAPIRIDVPNPDGVWLGWQFSVARDATIYYELRDAVGLDILVTRPVAGQYLTSQRLGEGVNSFAHDFAPHVHPDEDYILFNSNRAGGFGFNDVYVSFRDESGGWMAPQNLGPDINTWFEDTHPVVTPDGRYFFFTTQRAGDLGYNPYWVDSAVIDTLRPPTAVLLQSFTAMRREQDVVLKWAVHGAAAGSEYLVWREDGDGPRERITPIEIGGPGPYAYRDDIPPTGHAEYWLQLKCLGGSAVWLGSATVPAAMLPAGCRLLPNHPNPFNPSTNIQFEIPENAVVTLRVYSIGGQLVTTLVEDVMRAGRHSAVWRGIDAQGRQLASGTYFCRLQVDNYVATKSMTLLK
jgi:hypothetical protein